MHGRDSFETDRMIRLLHGVNRVVARGYHQLDVSGSIDLPRKGGAIIISNHLSPLDPLLIQSAVKRPIVWMMAREYYEIPWLRGLFELIRVIPVSRDGKDSSALRSALRTLESGRVLGIFPEGRIETTRELLPFQTGAALIALRGGAPVTPVYHHGTTFGQSMIGSVLLPQRVRMRFGPPIDLLKQFGKTREIEAPTEALFRAVATLRDAMDSTRVSPQI